MSEKKYGEPGDSVELKDKDTGFTDPETQFDISRDQTRKLGDSVGSATQSAIMSGALLIVGGSKAKKTEDDGPTDDYDLPADLPGREAFVANGITTFAGVKELDSEEQLLALKGIGAGTVKALAAWAAANKPSE